MNNNRKRELTMVRATRSMVDCILLKNSTKPVTLPQAKSVLDECRQSMGPLLKAHNAMLNSGAAFLTQYGMYVKRGKDEPWYCNVTTEGLPDGVNTGDPVWHKFNVKNMNRSGILDAVNAALGSDYGG